MSSSYVFLLVFIFGTSLLVLAEELCFTSLGASENGTLPSSAFTASSENDFFYKASHGRLGNAPSAWIPKNFQPITDLYDEFLQINFQKMFTITGIATQGFTSGIFFVKTFFLKFSTDGEIFDDYLHTKVLKIFEANVDTSGVVVQKLPCSVVAKYIQFVPLEFANGIALKVDVFGCGFTEEKDNQIEDYKVERVTTNGAEISWNQNSLDIEFFYIAYYPIGDSSSLIKYLVNPQNYKGTDKNIYIQSLSGLFSCTDYQIRLSVYNKIGCGVPRVYSITTSTLPSKPIPPQKVEYEILQPETVFLRWQKSRIGYNCAKFITNFKIEYRLHSTRSSYAVVQVSGSASFYNLTGLQGWQKYDIRIQSIGTYGESDYITYTISVEGKVPDQQIVITTLVSEEPQTILVKWQNPPVEKVNGYSVYFRVKSVPPLEWEHIGLPSTATSIRISPTAKMLEPWKTYQVYISLYNIRHKLDSTIEEVLVKGKAPGLAPSNLVADIKLETKISLHWESVSMEYLPVIFQGYQMFYAEGNETLIKAHVYPSMETQRIMQNLKPGTIYRFAVAAVSNNLLGPYSNILEVQTNHGQLNPPKINVASNYANTIFVEWFFAEDVFMSSLTVSYKILGSGVWSSKVILSGKNNTIAQLEPWVEYEVQVELDSFGRKATSDIKKVLVIGEAPGSAPKNLYATSVEESRIGLVWESIEPVFIPKVFNGYQVWAALDNESFYSASEFIMNTQYTVRNLAPASSYKFKVTAISNKQFGPFSEVLSLSTLPIKAPLSPIITEVEKKPGKIKINWESRSNSRVPISLFIITLRDRKSLQENTTFHYTDSDAYDQRSFSRLIAVPPFTSFVITLKSCIRDTCSPASDEMFITTMEDAPSHVLNLQVQETLDDVYVSWEPPIYVKGILRGYMVELIDPLTNKIISTDIPDNTTNTKKYHGLPCYIDLIVRVKAMTALVGPAVNKTFRSPEGLPTAPTNFKAILLKEDLMSVTWDSPSKANGVITKFKVVCIGTKSYNPSFISNYEEEVDFNIYVVRIKGLQPGTTYKVQVSARTIKGYGEASLPRYFNTPVKAPPPPPIPITEKVSSSSIVIHLSPSADVNGPISAYQIIIEELESSLLNRVSRKRRSQELPQELHDYQTAKSLGHKFYITAEIDAIQVPSKFEVGDGVNYNGYLNAPLQPKTKYQLHVRGKIKSPEGLDLYGAATTLSLPLTREDEEHSKFSFPKNTLIIIICCILVLIGLFIFCICFKHVLSRFWKRHHPKSYSDPVKISLVPIQRKGSDYKDGTVNFNNINLNYPPIEVTAFPKAVAKLHKNDNIGFKEDYKQLKIGKEFPYDIAHLPENKPKNRYANIVAYDHSRVILSKIENEPGSDYINASYLDTYKKANSAIATQGPLPNTFNDFWRMVWEVTSSCIVMLTNLQEKNKLKCHKYWPDASNEYGQVIVNLLAEEIFADYTIRSFKIAHKNFAQEFREVKQFHFTSWPDHGVPTQPTALLSFWRKVRSYEKPKSGPIIVHCSAGVGRTGVYIALDAMLDRLKEEGTVDTFNFITAMRMRRIAMVQTEDQYIFLHDAIVEEILSADTAVSIASLRNTIKKLNQIDNDSKVSGFEKQWKILNHGNPIQPASEVAMALQNNSKNRFSTILPTDSSRVLLLPIDGSEETTYINAVYIDSYKQKNAYILSQCPLPKTVADFWRMVCEHGSSTIVMLNTLDEGDDYATFWPEKGSFNYGKITVASLESSKSDDINLNGVLKLPVELNVRNFKVSDVRQSNMLLTVKLLQYTGWTETRVPTNYKTMISLLVIIQKWIQQSKDSPIIILCSDGVGRSGTLAAILYTLEQLKIEQVVDVFQAVKRMRMHRPHLVKYMDQYRFIYLVVQEYLNTFGDRTK
ncbi:receptor-type tyrosine-protein phosphatase F isoform X1 [Hydra vulgaris]|uniref:receptor-type tyrosine-protein phosphatase F isoform X1 n=1 Tax=Hydra vulgaris TaxID=6087 RepID=UPI0032E9F0D0